MAPLSIKTFMAQIAKLWEENENVNTAIGFKVFVFLTSVICLLKNYKYKKIKME